MFDFLVQGLIVFRWCGMKRFTDAGRSAIEANNLYAGLSLALTLPDICASLEDPGPNKSKARYLKWCKEWVEPKFTTPARLGMPRRIMITALDCYRLRNSLIHSGSAALEGHEDELKRFEFFDKEVGSHLNRFDGPVINGVPIGSFIQLKADLFSMTLFKAADEWDASVRGNAAVQAQKENLLTIRSRGFSIGNGAIVFG